MQKKEVDHTNDGLWRREIGLDGFWILFDDRSDPNKKVKGELLEVGGWRLTRLD